MNDGNEFEGGTVLKKEMHGAIAVHIVNLAITLKSQIELCRPPNGKITNRKGNEIQMASLLHNSSSKRSPADRPSDTSASQYVATIYIHPGCRHSTSLCTNP